LIDAQGRNQIATVPGANNRLEESDIDAAIPIVEGAKILGFQLEMRLEIVDYAIRKGRELGVNTVIITLGAGGSVLADSSVQEHYPAPGVNAVDSRGAGDI